MKRIFHTTPAPYVQNKRCKDRCRSLHLVFSHHSQVSIKKLTLRLMILCVILLIISTEYVILVWRHEQR